MRVPTALFISLSTFRKCVKDFGVVSLIGLVSDFADSKWCGGWPGATGLFCLTDGRCRRSAGTSSMLQLFICKIPGLADIDFQSNFATTMIIFHR